jgi:hypothetical protein
MNVTRSVSSAARGITGALAPALRLGLLIFVAGVVVAACRSNTTGIPPRVDGGLDTRPRDGGDAPVEIGPTCQNLIDKRGNGQTCGCDNECTSGFCAQGVCCNVECSGTCVACNLPGSPGVCGPVPAGQAPAVASQCVAEAVSSCGRDGKCDGAGACRSYPDGSICSAGACQGTAVVGAKICAGGQCVMGPPTGCSPYGCDASTGLCHTSCSSATQCDARACMSGSCGKKPLGATCSGNADCSSDFCADGVCCNLQCNGPCVSCNQVGRTGECTPVAAGNPDPHGVCKPEAKETCGRSGLCNGLGGCAKFAQGTDCRAATCTNGSETPMSTCDGEGVCQASTPIACAPFQCGATSCRISCTEATQATDCVAPNVCQNGSCGKRPLGQPCAAATECQSNFCVDGVCCNNSCVGTCVSCSLTNTKGRCTNVPAGTLDPRKQCVDKGVAMCNTNGKCNGNKGCETYAAGSICKAASCDTASNRGTQASTCVGGRCTPPAAQSCAPFKCGGAACANTCASNNDCVAPNTCVNNSCGKKPNGLTCGAAAECLSNFCADGVCCESACTASCFSCKLAGTAGQCVAVAPGANDPKGRCTDQGPASCGTDGVCDGAGACRKYALNTTCVGASCTGGTQTAASKCDGVGRCVPGGTRACSPYVCNTNGSACFDSCVNNGSCLQPNTCSGGSCGKTSNGGACSAGTECASGNCVDGICFDTACTGQCKSCKETGSVGTCKNVAAGTVDPSGTCAASAPASCGNDGKCDAAGACSKWGTNTTCRDKSCAAGGSTAVLEAKCDGAGACPAMQTQSCGSFKCDAAAGVCLQTCTSDGDCSSGTCNGGSCGLKALGAACTAGGQCMSNNCVDGACCSVPSCGTCQKCSNNGACANVANEGTDSDTCSDETSPSNPCGKNGKCDGNGGCKNVPQGGGACAPVCATADTAQQAQACNGMGGCAPVGGTVSCGAFTCNTTSGTCRNTCTSDAHCVSPKICNTGNNLCEDPPPPPDPDAGM